ncbi:MAG: hypothetical protein QXO71_11260 [Candidatus Jordarchaeaceae archaeon]
MLPRTNFDEIYTYLRCPSRLYLKLSGYKSEVERPYTPPSVPPVKLGMRGEEEILRGFLRETDMSVPDVKTEKVRYLKCGLDKFINNMTSIVKNNIEAVFSQCDLISVNYLPMAETKIARDLKKEFGVTAIIERVNYTTVPHHYVGEIDFLGLKEDNEVVVIEAKNKAEKLNTRDFLQLEYYMAGLPKQYQFTKIHEHMHELAAQLYPQKYLDYLSYMKKIDIMKKERFNLQGIILEGLERLKKGDRKKFLKRFTQKDNAKSIDEKIGKIVDVDEGSFASFYSIPEEYYEEVGAVEGFLMTIPEYVKLIRTIKEYSGKVALTEKDFYDTANFVAEIMSKGIRRGLLVDVRRGQIKDLSLTTDFDAIAKGIWSVKKNVIKGVPICEKNTSSCKTCQYKKTCANIIKEQELEPVTSITSIVHKGFSEMNYKYSLSSERVNYFEDEIKVFRKPATILFYDKKIDTFSDLPNIEILKPILLKSDWGYKDWFAQKRGWKSLFIDALASKKLELEFNFWKI